MPYLSQANIKASASGLRLRLLVDELKGCGCEVRVNQEERYLEFAVCDGDLWWIRSGCLGKLLASYEDVVYWRPEFREDPAGFERRKVKRQTPLPPPGQR